MRTIKIVVRWIKGDWWKTMLLSSGTYAIINTKHRYTVIPEDGSTKTEAKNACKYLNITRYFEKDNT